MSKEARALLKKINDKKNAIKSLVNEGKTKEAKEAKECRGQWDTIADQEYQKLLNEKLGG